MRSRNPLILGLLVALSVYACGEGGGSGSPDEASSAETTEATSSVTTTPAETAPTETAATPTSGDVETLDAFMPPECVDLYIEYLKELEPLFPATWGAIQVMEEDEMQDYFDEVDVLSDRYSETLEDLGCPNHDPSERLDVMGGMLETARIEVPGALPIIEWFADFFGYYDDIDLSTGDCDADLAALQVYFETTKLSQLDAREGREFSSLWVPIFHNCPDHLEGLPEALTEFGS